MYPSSCGVRFDSSADRVDSIAIRICSNSPRSILGYRSEMRDEYRSRTNRSEGVFRRCPGSQGGKRGKQTIDAILEGKHDAEDRAGDHGRLCAAFKQQ